MVNDAPGGQDRAMSNPSHLPTWSEPGPEPDPHDASPDGEAGAEASDTADPTGTVLLEQAVRVTTGLVALGIASVAEGVRRTLPTAPSTDEPSPARVDALGVATGALLGFTLLVGDRVATAVRGVSRTVGPPASWIAGVPPLGPAAGWVRATATSLDERWHASRPGTEAVATAFARELVPQVIDAVLDQLDLTWLVAERVDLDDLVARVDLDRAVARVDIERIVSRVDLDEVASRIDVDAVVSRVDLDAIVKRIDLDDIVARVDLDAVARRIDVAGIIERLDLAGLARTVIEEIDLPEIIRQSTGSVASETVRGVRMQGIQADESVSKVVDRMLFRNRVDDAGAPDEPAAPDETGDPGPHV